MNTFHCCLVLCATVLVAACAPSGVRPEVASLTPADAALRVPELKPIAHWVGGRWIGTFEAGGSKFTLVRTYEWSFDRRIIIGRSFAEHDGKLMQLRETPYYWNPQTKRIEFLDFLDSGGHGEGVLQVRDGKLAMEAKVVGNPAHPSWRATIRDEPDMHEIHVEALRDGKWVDFGTYPYRRAR